MIPRFKNPPKNPVACYKIVYLFSMTAKSVPMFGSENLTIIL